MLIYIYFLIAVLIFKIPFIESKIRDIFSINIKEKYTDLWDANKSQNDMKNFTSGLFGGIVSAIEAIGKAIQPKIPGKRPCPDGMRDDGTSCWKDTYPNGVGTVPNLNPCPDGSNDVAGTCWYPDRGCTGGCRTWWDGCKSRAPGWLGGGCIGGANTKCTPIKCNPATVARNIGDRGYNCGGKKNVAGLCYNRCRPGYHFAGGNLCEPDGGPGIKVTAFKRYECPPPGEPKHTKLVGALCYVP